MSSPASELSAALWTQLPPPTTSTRVFTRTLGPTEAAFYWDGEFEGTSDVVERTTVVLAPQLRIAAPEADADRFRAIWVLLKRRFPLLAARVDELDGGDALRFVVDEARVLGIQDASEFVELEYIPDADVATVQRALGTALNSPPGARRISPRTGLAAVSILRRVDAGAEEVTYDIVLLASHAIVDGMASCTITRTFCSTLARWPDALSDPLPNLADRLRMVPAMDTLYPYLTLNISLPRRRWRRAIAAIIQARRGAAMRGGHSLPGTRTPSTPRTSAHSRALRARTSVEQTTALVKAARAHAVSVAHVLPVLAYAALARVLHRRRQRGEIDDKEWAARTRSVVHVGGPLNARPFLAPEWVEKGGMSEVNLSISFWTGQLPHIPSTPADADSSPPLPAVRFWRLVARTKSLMTRHYQHPLFFDMAEAVKDARVVRGRRMAEVQRRLRTGEDVPVPVADPNAVVFGAIFSSMGNVDTLLPSEFKAAASGGSSSSEVMLRRTRSDTFLRCRPAELYLGAKTERGTMEFYVFYDGNVYADDVVQEWLDMVCEAAAHYGCGPEGDP